MAASNFLVDIGYEEEKTLEEKKRERAPNFSVPETLVGYTKPALFNVFIDQQLLSEEDVSNSSKQLNLSGLNKLFRICTGREKVFEVRRNFFREFQECVNWIGDNDVARSDQFTREGLAKIVDRYCEV